MWSAGRFTITITTRSWIQKIPVNASITQREHMDIAEKKPPPPHFF